MVGLQLLDNRASTHGSVVVVGKEFKPLVEFGLGTGLGVAWKEVEFIELAGGVGSSRISRRGSQVPWTYRRHIPIIYHFLNYFVKHC